MREKRGTEICFDELLKFANAVSLACSLHSQTRVIQLNSRMWCSGQSSSQADTIAVDEIVNRSLHVSIYLFNLLLFDNLIQLKMLI